MSTDILILGVDGQQGSIASRFLTARGWAVEGADIYNTGASCLRHVHFCDHRTPGAVRDLIKSVKPRMVLNAANDFYNDAVLDACLIERVDCVDFGSDIPGTKRRIARHREAVEAGITFIMGCGSTPGINSVMFAKLAGQLARVDTVNLGFAWDSNMKHFFPPFFLYVVALELSLPAHVLKDGAIQEIEPYSISATSDFKLVGRQKLVVVSHSEIYSFNHYFKDKGLREVVFWAGFPEHSAVVIDSIIKLGLNSPDPFDVITESGPAKVTPCDFLTAAGKRIKTPDGYTEAECLWVKVEGVDHHGRVAIKQMTCHVPPLRGWESHGCNVDTAFPGCVIAEMVLDGVITESGVFCPEGIVPPEVFLDEIRRLGMEVVE